MACGLRRAAAGGAVVCVLVGVVLVAVAGSTLPWTAYLSEAGSSAGYRAGILVLALGLGLLAVSLPPALRLGAVLLGAGAGLAAVSGAVPCTAGCPLPPYEPTTSRDLVHAGASIAAVAACVFAMVAVGLASEAWLSRFRPAAVAPAFASSGHRDFLNRGPTRTPEGARFGKVRVRGRPGAAGRVSLVAAAVALPLSAIVGVAMLATGRGALVGVAERILLAVTAAWAGYLAVSSAFAAGPGVDVEAPSRS